MEKEVVKLQGKRLKKLSKKLQGVKKPYEATSAIKCNDGSKNWLMK